MWLKLDQTQCICSKKSLDSASNRRLSITQNTSMNCHFQMTEVYSINDFGIKKCEENVTYRQYKAIIRHSEQVCY